MESMDARAGPTRSIRRLDPSETAALLGASSAGLFDRTVDPEGAHAFLGQPGHHVLIAYEDGQPVGFVTGVELTHPDKGAEMFLYELSVDRIVRKRGIGTALVAALRDLAVERKCRGMWVLTDSDNLSARAAYRKAGATRQAETLMLEWDLSQSSDRGSGDTTRP
jgi:ribosomal protein S18 acetylase RimI-like enzyme